MNSFIIGSIAILVYICFYFLSLTNKKNTKPFVWIIYSVLFALSVSSFIYKIFNTILHPQFWDFTCFYLYGKVSSGGYNFYSPESFHSVFNSLKLPAILNSSNSAYAGFITECVNVGFPYPPPTILYFAPLGYLSYQTALILWTLFISSFAIACIYLIYSMFFKEYKLNGLMLVATLFFILSQTRGTVFYTQTNFILLFLLLLMKKFSNRKIAGIFLTLAIFTKPFMLIFGLYFLFRKKWYAILYFIGSSIILVGFTLALFGIEVFKSYVFNNPVNRLPKSVFFEDINQSLHSVLLRHNIITLDNPKVYMIIAILILSLTIAFLLYLLKRKLYDNIWSVLLLIGMMIYPGTLGHYGVLLLFFIPQFFEKDTSYFNRYINILLIGIFYLLISFSLFSTICFLLIIVIYKSLNPNFLKKENFLSIIKN